MSEPTTTWGAFKAEVERQLREQGCTDVDKADIMWIDIGIDDVIDILYDNYDNRFKVS